MDEKETREEQDETTTPGADAGTRGGTGPSEHAGSARDRKEIEDRLDGFADKFSRAMSDGVKKLEDAFDKGKDNLRQDMETREGRRLSGSPRLGALLLGLGIVWLLYSLGVLRQPIFPVILIVLGVYFLLRNR